MALLQVSGAVGESQFTTAREIRNLAHLNRTASSWRVMNLAKVFVHHREAEAWAEHPLFENSLLNRAIILKHSLRVDERHLFSSARHTVTKIILPFDPFDLRLGGRSIYVRQTGFDDLMQSYLGIDTQARSRDLRVLLCLDALPSLDPFLVREHLGRIDVRAATLYYQISSADLKEMAAFTAQRVEDLVRAALGGGLRRGGAAKLGEKILSDDLDQELLPLRDALGMNPDAFYEGVMCWRGFLYYRWCHAQLQIGVRELLQGLSHYKPNITHDDILRNYVRNARPRLAKAVVKTLREIGKALEAYDDVYHALAHDRDPAPFRDFLQHGSHLFLQLGERVGILNHMVSFWRFRMGKVIENNSRPLESIEFADILVDFEASVAAAIQSDDRSAA